MLKNVARAIIISYIYKPIITPKIYPNEAEKVDQNNFLYFASP
jgi:hypothetical protein